MSIKHIFSEILPAFLLVLELFNDNFERGIFIAIRLAELWRPYIFFKYVTLLINAGIF